MSYCVRKDIFFGTFDSCYICCSCVLQVPPKSLMVAELEVPTVPPPEWDFSAEPPSISALEL